MVLKLWEGPNCSYSSRWTTCTSLDLSGIGKQFFMCLTQLCTMCGSMNCPFVPDYLSRMSAEWTKLWETKTEQESHTRAKLRQVYCLLKTSEFPKLKVPQLQHKPTAGSPWSASLPTLKRLRLGVNLQELGSQAWCTSEKASVSDSGVSCPLPASIQPWQANLIAST